MRTTSSGTCCSVFRQSIQLFMLLVLTIATVLLRAENPENALRFRGTQAGEFTFDTGVLRGTLRAFGRSEGLSEVVHIPSGKKISQTHGLVGHYRLLAANQRFLPDGWSTPSEAAVGADGSVEVHWPAVGDRPFELWATYRWAAPDVLDVETRVRAHATLQAFESFLASYFAEDFSRASAWVQAGKGAFTAAEESGGPRQMFPRDDTAVQLIQDGRWKYPPNPVDWGIRTALALPIGVRRDTKSGLAAAVMAPASDCFAVSMPVQGDSHRSLYLSLFGRDLKTGETSSARARLVVGAFGDDEILKLYQAFQRSLDPAVPNRKRPR